MRNEPLEQKPDHQINLGGLQRPVWGVSLLPYLLSRIGLVISMSLLPVSDAVHCNRLCSALQPLLQCTASVLAVHCICSRKRLHPRLQTLSSRVANVIILGCKRYHLGLQTLSSLWTKKSFLRRYGASGEEVWHQGFGSLRISI